MDRLDWLAERRTGIGSSDAAKILGVSPFGQALDVYLDKLGLLPEEESAPMRWGSLLEDVVAQAFTEETGLTVRPSPGLVRHRHYAWMLATPDRLLPGVAGILECKTARSADGWGASGTDEIPDAYLVQVQHQMEVLGADLAWVAVLLAGSDFRCYQIPRDERIVRHIMRQESLFWACVCDRNAPDPDWLKDGTAKLVELLHRPAEGMVIDLPAVGCFLVDEYQSLGAQIKLLKETRARTRADLFCCLGDSAEARMPDGRKVVRKTVNVKAHARAASQSVRMWIKGGSQDGDD